MFLNFYSTLCIVVFNSTTCQFIMLVCFLKFVQPWPIGKKIEIIVFRTRVWYDSCQGITSHLFHVWQCDWEDSLHLPPIRHCFQPCFWASSICHSPVKYYGNECRIKTGQTYVWCNRTLEACTVLSFTSFVLSLWFIIFMFSVMSSTDDTIKFFF